MGEKHLIKCSTPNCPNECERVNWVIRATCFECKKKKVVERNRKFRASMSKEELQKYRRASYYKMKRLCTGSKKKSIV